MARLSVELQRYFLSTDALTDGLTGGLHGPLANAPASGPVDSIGRRTDSRNSKEVTLNEILEIAGERTFGFLFVLLALPSALPVPAPGYSVPFGVVMLLLAVQLIAGSEQPWFPAFFRKRGFERKSVQGIIRKGIPWLERIEMVSRPRLTSVCTSRTGRAMIGLAIALMSISMMIPIPLTNTLPAMGIFVTGFGLLDDDGAISLAGLTICVMGAALSSTILYLVFHYGIQGMMAIVDAAKASIKP
ncbi:MAG: exopolysaccharide biosynthesis protein [Phormidesmis sp.]